MTQKPTLSFYAENEPPTKILIIDDEPLIRRALADYLTEYGYETAMAVDGEDGLLQAQNGSFQAVLVDLRMPRVDGLKVVATLKTQQPELPVVVVSGTGVLSDVIEAIRQGAWDYVTKPIQDMDEITVVINRVLEKAKLRAERDRYQHELEELNRSLEAEVARRVQDLRQVNIQLGLLLAQIQEQAAQVQQIVDTVPEGVILLDAERQVVMANPTAANDLPLLTGVSVGDPLTRLGNHALADLLIPPPEKGLWHEVTADSRSFEVIARSIETGPTPGGWVLVIRDVTQEREIERRIKQQERLAVVGQLAAGIAHDFNNLLTVITGYSELLLHRYIDKNQAIHRDLEQIHKAGKQAAVLTRKLLSFSRQDVVQPEVLDINSVIGDIQELLRRLISENIEFITTLDPLLSQIKADTGQIEQIIMNLVVNACDAMPQGGKLALKTANAKLDEAFTRPYPGLKPGSYVLLTISDTGIGMDIETQSRIFEPFFTTKPQGKGTGLGLATVYGIVQQNKGHIAVSSQPGQGATFYVYLPCLKQPSTSAQPRQSQTETTAGTETILLVEDEDMVRELAAYALKQIGYRVLEARHGQDALEVLAQHNGPIDLLLTDVVMPGGLSGRQLAERLVISHPETKVLYMSGYADEAIVQHGILAPDIAFLQKPFSPTSLSRKVREVLDSPKI